MVDRHSKSVSDFLVLLCQTALRKGVLDLFESERNRLIRINVIPPGLLQQLLDLC